MLCSCGVPSFPFAWAAANSGARWFSADTQEPRQHRQEGRDLWQLPLQTPFHCCCFVGSLAKADVSPPGRSVGISVLRRANVAVMACASRSHLKPYACASIQILQKFFRPPTALGHPVEEYLSYQSLAWLDRQSPVNRHAYPWRNQ